MQVIQEKLVEEILVYMIYVKLQSLARAPQIIACLEVPNAKNWKVDKQNWTNRNGLVTIFLTKVAIISVNFWGF